MTSKTILVAMTVQYDESGAVKDYQLPSPLEVQRALSLDLRINATAVEVLGGDLEEITPLDPQILEAMFGKEEDAQEEVFESRVGEL